MILDIHEIVSKILSSPKDEQGRVVFDPIEAMSLYREGYTLEVIGDHFGVAGSTVRRYIKDFPDYKEIVSATRQDKRVGPDEFLQGEAHQSARPVITPQGRFPTSLLAAAAFNVSKTTVNRWASNSINGWRFETSESNATHRRERMWRYFTTGATVDQIAAMEDISGTAIRGLFDRHHRDEYQKIILDRQANPDDRDKKFSREMAWDLLQSGKSSREVASVLGVTSSSIQRAFRDEERYQTLVADRNQQERPESWVFPHDEAYVLYQSGMTFNELAMKYDVRRHSIEDALNRYPLTADISKANRERGLKNGRKKGGTRRPQARTRTFTQEEIDDICDDTDSNRKIARRYGVQHKVILKLKRTREIAIPPRIRSVITPEGTFENLLKAAKANGVSHASAQRYASQNRHGWSYLLLDDPNLLHV